MQEIEVLVTFDSSKEEVLNVLSQFHFIKEVELYDTYYIDPLRKNLKPESDLRLNETFRIRRNQESCYVTYKKQHFEGKLWIYSDEYEAEVKDYKTMEQIVSMLGLEPLIIVHNKRKVYQYLDYEIVFEDVRDLGYFLEVEKLCKNEANIMKVKEEIRDFIRSIHLKNTRELNIGKNQYLLSKKMGVSLNIFNNTKY